MTEFTIQAEVGDRIDICLEQLRQERKLVHEANDEWPVERAATAMDLGDPLVSLRTNQITRAVYEREGGIAALQVYAGTVYARMLADTAAAARGGLEQLRRDMPRGESRADEVAVTFWTYSPHGPRSVRRDVDAASWGDIAGNYPSATTEAVARMMSDDFRPGRGGQLVLWHGDPGTGKTTALRALAREWRSWCDMHYIVDPDHFFGSHADYMMDVLMGDQLQPASGVSGSSVPRWRLLVLEDCGEMLQPDARREVGQALSRLLNACDGLIGRGLRVMVLVTTNEPVSKLHEAVSRPGRCAARIEFERFTSAEAASWLAARNLQGRVEVGPRPALADLYAQVDGTARREQARQIGFAA